jgi:aldehyde dehydrogenase (NAD+)
LAEDIPSAGNLDVDDAMQAAQAAFKTTWGILPGNERAKKLLKFADILEENAALLARLEMIAMGQPISVALEVAKMVPAMFRYYAGYCDKIYGEMLPEDGSGQYSLVQYQPMGVCAGIGAWNATLLFFAVKVAPALAAGNTFIFKPSEKSPLAALALGDLIASAGFPPGTINIVTGSGETGALLASHMLIRKISFTGSLAAGRKVQQAATASNLKSVTLELGGKSPSIIFGKS